MKKYIKTSHCGRIIAYKMMDNGGLKKRLDTNGLSDIIAVILLQLFKALQHCQPLVECSFSMLNKLLAHKAESFCQISPEL